MSSMVKHLSLWTGVALMAILDALLCIQILAFIDYSQNARSGSARMWVITKIHLIALASIPIALSAVRSYFAARRDISPPALFLARLPLICLGGLLLTYFVALQFIRYLYA